MVADEYLEVRIASTAIGNKGACQAPKMIHSRSGTGASNSSTRRNNPSFSSALLEAISKSTEDESMKFPQGQDLKSISTSKSRKMEIPREPRLHSHTRSDEIDVFEAERYFSSWGNGRSKNPTGRGEEAQVTGSIKHHPAGQFSFQPGVSDSCSEGSITSANANTPYWQCPSSEVEPGRLNRYGEVVSGSAEHIRSGSRNSYSLDYPPRSRVQHDGVLSDQSSANATKASKESRKPKQPTSPGSKLASFLNSLFIPTSAKKKKKKKAKHSGPVGSNGGDDEDDDDDGPACGSRGKIRYENPGSYPRSFSIDLGGRTPQSARTNSSATSSMASWTISNSSQLSELYKSVMQENMEEHVVKGHHHHQDSSSVDASSYHHPHHHHHHNFSKLKSSFVNSHNRSNKNGSNGLRRSVTFYPTSVILDENARPCGEKHLSRVDNPKNCNLPLLSKKLRLQLLEKGEVPSQYLIHHLDTHGKDSHRAKDRHDEENHDDVASDSSSDLFDLENFDAMDTSIYSRDLPVYETTQLETNQAIANGLLR